VASRFFENPCIPFVGNVLEFTFVCGTDVDFGSPLGDPNIAAVWEMVQFFFTRQLLLASCHRCATLRYCACSGPGESATLLG
jgi:hypothetical protein